MVIDLPIISKGLKIGEINLEDNSSTITKDSHAIKFTCTSTVECCSTLKIPVTQHDIKRIEENGYELDQIIESLSPVILPSKTPSGNTEKVYTLKRKPFDGTCRFLNNETKLCEIHEFKPFACKTYPFSLDILDEHRISIVIHTESLCSKIQSVKKSDCNNKEHLDQLIYDIGDELQRRGIKN